MLEKARRQVALMLLGLCALLLATATPAYATVTQVGTPTTTSFQVKWDKWTPSSASYSFKNYQVLVGKDYSSAKVYKTITSADTTTCTVSGLPAGSKRCVRVKTNYIYTNSYDGTQTAYDQFQGSLYAKTLPGTVSGLKQDRWYYFILKFNAKWNAVESADGYDWICYKDSGKKFKSGQITYGTSSPSTSIDKIKNTQIYKMKVRAYTTIAGKKHYGSWSPYSYFFTQPRITKAKVSNGKLKVKWKKVSGATSYSIYVSTKPTKGYKKVKTVSKKKSSVTIKKFKGKKFKKSKKYYVYVVTNKMVNGKTSTSGRLYYWNTKDSPSQFGYF